MANAMVDQKWLNSVMSKFLEGIDGDEREGMGVAARAGDVNALLASVDDPDPQDITDAIMEAIPNARDVLDEEHVVDLLDIVDQCWPNREIS